MWLDGVGVSRCGLRVSGTEIVGGRLQVGDFRCEIGRWFWDIDIGWRWLEMVKSGIGLVLWCRYRGGRGGGEVKYAFRNIIIYKK